MLIINEHNKKGEKTMYRVTFEVKEYKNIGSFYFLNDFQATVINEDVVHAENQLRKMLPDNRKYEIKLILIEEVSKSEDEYDRLWY